MNSKITQPSERPRSYTACQFLAMWMRGAKLGEIRAVLEAVAIFMGSWEAAAEAPGEWPLSGAAAMGAAMPLTKSSEN